jgi:hypothetical protein
MNGYLYEKDLTSMKFAILKSSRHDRLIREISSDLDIPANKLRKYIMSRFDMILMENLPARYEEGRKMAERQPFPDRELGSLLYTRAVPIVEERKMEEIVSDVKDMIVSGVSEKEAVLAGKNMIREVITG